MVYGTCSGGVRLSLPRRELKCVGGGGHGRHGQYSTNMPMSHRYVIIETLMPSFRRMLADPAMYVVGVCLYNAVVHFQNLSKGSLAIETLSPCDGNEEYVFRSNVVSCEEREDQNRD